MFSKANSSALKSAGAVCIFANPEKNESGSAELHDHARRELNLVIAAIKKDQPGLFYTPEEARARNVAAELRAR